MRLSVIIVSFNVRYFLEKCIGSVLRALRDIDGEVIVVDNHSADHSAEMVSTRFPGVLLIKNSVNLGFAKACNQGLRIAQGEYALLLNPDTLVSENTFKRCLEFMDAHPQASACGVRMVDGTGTYLPESMRGLPTPLTAFFKMTGAGSLFPKSMFFNGYYMGGLDPEHMHAVPVLTGAFMFIRMSAIREIGMLDEDFFMYGEDIDLCYRMHKAGYQNYYLPEPSIIHYKGESTHRGSIRYVVHFYKAMMIYVSKHMRGTGGSVFKLMIMMGVFVRGMIGGVRRLIARLMPVLVDGILMVIVLLLVRKLWAHIYFEDPDHFDRRFITINTPLYVGVWLASLFLSGAFDIRRNPRRIFYGMALGTIVILVIYAILPLQYRSSRAVIFISAFLVTVLVLIQTAIVKYVRTNLKGSKNVVIVGSRQEVNRIMELMNRMGGRQILSGWIACSTEDEGPALLGHISQLEDIVWQHRIDEVIFSSEDLSFTQINTWMSRLGPAFAYRISSSGSGQIVGSDSRKEQGTLYTADVSFALAYPGARRAKRMFDICAAFILLCLTPLRVFPSWRERYQLRNVFDVIQGTKTWIGYHPGDEKLTDLPDLKQSVFYPGQRHPKPHDASEIHMINYIYAREYHFWKDLDLLLRNLSRGY